MLEYKQNQRRVGKGLLNKVISNLPFELHLPGYQYCGPGTKLQNRLERGDLGINPLDAACKEHDIAYSQHKDIESRHIADKILSEKAWQRFKSSNAAVGERLNSWIVTNAMKTKVKFGMGLNKKNKKKKKTKSNISLQKGIRKARNILKSQKPSSINDAINLALSATKPMFRGYKKSKIKTPRVIPIPKIGGILPLIPIFAGLSALGALTGGAAGIAKVVHDAADARKNLKEANRHNETMEAIALGKTGSGLYLKPYRKGLGLYLNPPSKNY